MDSKEDLLADMDATLDQLIRNAESIKHLSLHQLEIEELQSLQKTQESLLARLIHTDLLAKNRAPQQKRPQFEKKLHQYQKLNQRFMKTMQRKLSQKVRVQKRTSARSAFSKS